MIVPKITPPGEFLLIHCWSGKHRETMTSPVHMRLYSGASTPEHNSPALDIDTIFTIECAFRDPTLF